jgi:hypothetical protein
MVTPFEIFHMEPEGVSLWRGMVTTFASAMRFRAVADSVFESKPWAGRSRLPAPAVTWWNRYVLRGSILSRDSKS